MRKVILMSVFEDVRNIRGLSAEVREVVFDYIPSPNNWT